MSNKIVLKVLLNSNTQFDEMIANNLIVVEVFRNKQKIDNLVVDLVDFVKTERMNDTQAYRYFAQKRAEQKRAMN